MNGRLTLQLLPRAQYSGSDPVQLQSLGVSLQRQRGVHAIGSDHRVDFDTWPGVLAYTPTGVQVFSESATGGEYLVARWTDDLAPQGSSTMTHRHEVAGHGDALTLGRRLRRDLLDPAREEMAVEETALRFVMLRSRPPPSKAHAQAQVRLPRPVYARILDRIHSEFDQPLLLSDLAAAEHLTELRLLNEFKLAVGMTPHAYLVETRVQAARRLLQDTDARLSEIALDCGFAHQSHMGSAFRSILGHTPKDYRRMHRKSKSV